MSSSIVTAALLLASIGLLSGLLLAWASKKFHVETDPLVDAVYALLPKTNCGACGYPGCRSAAEAVIRKAAQANVCLVGGRTTAAQVCKLLGITSTSEAEINFEKLPVAVLRCQAGKELCQSRFEYEGEHTCSAEQHTGGGSLSCAYGCLAHGDCAKVCPVNAITLRGKLPPKIERALCIGCKKCVTVCPRKIISIESRQLRIITACNSQDPGADTNKLCQVGCIDCQLCVKACPLLAYSGPRRRLPKVDAAKCELKKECVSVCPKKTIVSYP